MQDTDSHTPHKAAAADNPAAAVFLSDARVAAWLRLERAAGIGPRTASKLLDAFGCAEGILEAGSDELAALIGPAQLRSLKTPASIETEQLIEATLRWRAQPGHHILALGEPGYPELLANIPDPPLLLYIKGRVELLDAPMLAMVGSRNASVQGKANALAFAEALSGAGLCIVSGLALGIDAAAHEGALKGGGSTVAVIGTGPDLVYPARNRALCERIAAEGCIVSEYPVGTRPLPGNFPKRNRIISGLAAGVLVVEAAAQSGSLITARQAAEQGRDVFAIPGSIHAALAKGCHLLIREGAKLVDTAADVLEAMAWSPLVRAPAVAMPAKRPDETVPDGSEALLAALGHDPVEPDILIASMNISPALLSSQLLALELAGLLERRPGGRVQRVVK
ncbi:DNA processing protein DprA [Massilia sp. Bi118]|uniref:DNA-processing protein DprA n=1 Tax=Massilia sp. Bi118 TaxID=2822346 RepID=UPI001D99EA05|nr:DNA-processing protein DprA [Massilia sp. Bi118]CAH0153766.1 DNA processing protein DprA [Massilia sp. Bi118]